MFRCHRLRGFSFAFLTLASNLLLSGPASAQADNTSVLGAPRRRFESPQRFALEFRFGAYRPDIDSESGLRGTPYRNVFGESPRVLAALEFDWQVLRIPGVGTLGPGVGIGVTEMSEKARLTSDPTQQSAEDTKLQIIPMVLVGVFRVDVFARELGIPLVPYAKAGLGFAYWKASNGLGTSSEGGVRGEGGTLGTHLAGGLALHLNAFDRSAAVNLDNSIGINHVYVFAEYYMASLNGLGQSRPLRVGDNTWVAGLAFEF